MSRIGKMPVPLREGVQAKISPKNEVLLEKSGKSLNIAVNRDIEVLIEKEQLILKRKNDEKKTKAFHGLYRALLNNAVLGLTQGWSKTLMFHGVGYKAQVSGRKLELNLGYSHPISVNIPEGVEMKVEKNTKLHISGFDRQKVGQVSAQIRSLRLPEPYLGKGIKYSDEVIRKKAGKSGAEKK